MRQLHRNKLALVALAILVAGSFFLAYLHQHSDGLSFDHCSVCRFIHQIISFFLFAVTLLFSTAKPDFLVLESARPQTFFTSARLRNRAPPFLF